MLLPVCLFSWRISHDQGCCVLLVRLLFSAWIFVSTQHRSLDHSKHKGRAHMIRLTTVVCVVLTCQGSSLKLCSGRCYLLSWNIGSTCVPNQSPRFQYFIPENEWASTAVKAAAESSYTRLKWMGLDKERCVRQWLRNEVMYCIATYPFWSEKRPGDEPHLSD